MCLLLLKIDGILMHTTNSGRTCVFMCVLQIIYFFGDVKLSTPESNSGELGYDCVFEPTTSGFPIIILENNKNLIPSSLQDDEGPIILYNNKKNINDETH